MRKLIILSALIWTCLSSCLADVNTQVEDKGLVVFRVNGMHYQVSEITLDSCQYYASSYALCHKGNCNNPIHK